MLRYLVSIDPHRSGTPVDSHLMPDHGRSILAGNFHVEGLCLWGAGIEIADSFMIGDKPDALPQPVWADRVSFKIIKDSLEISFTLLVDPDFSDHSSPITLPA